MADTSDWSNWTFNFYYGEELRSLYMNGILLEGFRPGVYNANMLFYVAETSGAQTGERGTLNLIIKRGTTLIFSNNYCNIDGKVERDFFNLGKETFSYDDQYSYLIKCVANRDILITSDVFGDDFGKQGFLGRGYGDIHIFAKIKYQAKSTSTGSNSYPEVAIEPYYVLPTGTRGRYKKIAGADDYGSGSVVFDGMSYDEFVQKCTSGKDFLLYSFLELGIIRRKDSDITPLTFNNFVFTGHGLPEYRQSIVPGVSILAPDFYISPGLNKVYLDVPGISCDDVVYQNASKSSARDMAITPTDTEDIWNAIVPPIASGEIDPEKLFKYNNDDSKKYGYWVDLYYLAIDKKVSNNEDIDVENVLLTGSELYPSQDMLFKVESFKMKGPNDYNAEFRSVSSSTGEFVAAETDYSLTTSLDPGLDFELRKINRKGSVTKGSAFEHQLFDLNTNAGDLSYNASNPYYAPIVPLDVSIANQKRLLNIIRNKPIIPMLIDRLRQKLDNAALYSTIIPVALGFRKYVAKGDATTEYHWVGEVSDGTRMDPANILSLFDLQFRETKVYPITMKNSDVYNTLSVII